MLNPYGILFRIRSNFGYIFRSASGMWKSNQYPNLTLAEAGVRNTGRPAERECTRMVYGVGVQDLGFRALKGALEHDRV